jgi:putative addiction module component (TIGR02574 family)
MSLAAVKSTIVELSAQEKAELMHFLVDMLAEETLYLSEEWKEELTSRAYKLEHGISVGKPIREVLKKYLN